MLFTNVGFVPPPYEGTSAGGQSVNGGTHEGGHRPYGTLVVVSSSITIKSGVLIEFDKFFQNSQETFRK